MLLLLLLFLLTAAFMRLRSPILARPDCVNSHRLSRSTDQRYAFSGTDDNHAALTESKDTEVREADRALLAEFQRRGVRMNKEGGEGGGVDKEPFVVFSAGPLGLAHGQDMVLEVFRRFQVRVCVNVLFFVFFTLTLKYSLLFTG